MSCFEYVSEGPGPGAYNIPSTIGSTRSSSRSRSAGGNAKRGNTTAMGSSGTLAGLSRLHKRVPTRRDNLSRVEDTTPGPGAYNSTGLELKSKGPSFSMGPYRSTSQSGTQPLSGSNRRLLSRSGTHSSMTYSMLGTQSGTRNSITHDAVIEDVPGPGMYDVNTSYVRARSPSYSFGVRSKTPKQETAAVPGPGAYNPRLQSSGPSFSLSGRSPDRKPRSQSPGPGTYDPKLGSTGPSFSMRSRSPIKQYVI